MAMPSWWQTRLWQRKVEDQLRRPDPGPDEPDARRTPSTPPRRFESNPSSIPRRVGIVGFSQNANTVLALSGMPYSRYLGAPPFAAIVSFYPSCEIARHQN